MRIEIMNGQYPPHEALRLITDLIKVKIKFHEDKIDSTSSEEEIKLRESYIKKLQHELHQVRNQIPTSENKLTIKSEIFI